MRRGLIAPGDELKRKCADFLVSGHHSDDESLAPAFVAALQRLAHDVHIADAE